jgi:hypothetical protein
MPERRYLYAAIFMAGASTSGSGNSALGAILFDTMSRFLVFDLNVYLVLN